VEANARESATRSAVADRQRDRARLLAAEGILARMDLDAAEARALALGSDAEAARERLQAALIEHQRRQASAETEVNVAGTHLGAERAGIANLRLQLVAARRLRAPLEERLAVLERKRAQFALVALTGGTLFGDDLPRMAGQYFAKGTEICRIADTHEVLVRIQVAEQALGDLALGRHVRVKTRAFPDRTFHGVVSRIGAVSELDGNGQRTYRAELTIQNAVGSLRPGMTVFARVDFGRHVVAWLAAHKLRQALRPELWML
jgi:multidrug resistance efflux pump